MSRHRRILDVAAEAFHDKGFHGVGVDEIGTRAGLSGPSLYRHFSGKDELLATLLNEAMDELMSATAASEGDPEEVLLQALEHHVAFALEHRQLVSLYQREVRSLAEPWSRSFARRRRQYTRRWEALVAARLPDLATEDVSAATQACLGMVFSVTTWPDRVLRSADVAQVLLTMLTGGLPGLAGESAPGSA